MSIIMAGAEAPGEDSQKSQNQPVSNSPPMDNEKASTAQFEQQIGRLFEAYSGTLAWRITVGGRCLALAEQSTAKQYTAAVATACGEFPVRTLRQYRTEACLYAQLISHRRLHRTQIQADSRLLKKLELEPVAKQLADRRIYSSRDLSAAAALLPTDPATNCTETSPAAKSQRAQTMTQRLLASYFELPEGAAKVKCWESLRQLHAKLSQPDSEMNSKATPSAGAPEASKNPQPIPTED